jgi:hypothetical protein
MNIATLKSLTPGLGGACAIGALVGTAPDTDVSEAAESLRLAAHGREFIDWWRSHDELPAAQVARPVVQRRMRRHRHTRFEPRQSQTYARSANRDLTVGGAWLLGGLLVTVVSYTVWQRAAHEAVIT